MRAIEAIKNKIDIAKAFFDKSDIFKEIKGIKSNLINGFDDKKCGDFKRNI